MSKEYKVEEVNSGICTCTMRAIKVQEVINNNAKNGWDLVNFETVVGRRCGCFPSPKVFIVFSKGQ